MKYLALVAACLLALTLAQPATAADAADPVEITFPTVTELNPAHTPYVVEIHDPEPERGDLVASLNGWDVPLPHDGTATLPLEDVGMSYVPVRVFRCPVGGECVPVSSQLWIHLVTQLELALDYDRALGARSTLPVAGFTPELDPGDAVQLDWQLAATRGGEPITTGSANYVVGDRLPALNVPTTTQATKALLTVHAVTDSARWGRLEADAEQWYRIDFTAPPLSVRLSSDLLFPVRDKYQDTVDIRFGPAGNDLADLIVDLVGPDGTARRLYDNGADGNFWITINGTWDDEMLPAGRYTVRVVGSDRAGNTTVRKLSLRIDHRRAVRKTYAQTIPAARTLAAKYVGTCSRLGAAAGRDWKGSLGLYSTKCAKRDGAVVITVHGARLPKSVRGYPDLIKVSMYGGAARGVSSAYIVHGWLRASDNEFVNRSQFDGRLGSHATSAYPRNVVRTIDGKEWVFWQLGLSEGSRYDVKSFTVRCTYYALVANTSRTASEAKTIAEPSGAPGPGYTVPKTDAAELLAAYKPAM